MELIIIVPKEANLSERGEQNFFKRIHEGQASIPENWRGLSMLSVESFAMSNNEIILLHC